MNEYNAFFMNELIQYNAIFTNEYNALFMNECNTIQCILYEWINTIQYEWINKWNDKKISFKYIFF